MNNESIWREIELMENYTVCQLQRDMRYEGFLLIRSAEKRKDSKGNDYVDMNLTDRTGEINCKIWNWDPEAETPEAGQPIKVRGTIQEYNGRLQLRVEKMAAVHGRRSGGYERAGALRTAEAGGYVQGYRRRD